MNIYLFSTAWDDDAGVFSALSEFPLGLQWSCGMCQNAGFDWLPRGVIRTAGLKVSWPGRVPPQFSASGIVKAVTDPTRKAYRKAGVTGVRFLKVRELSADGKSAAFRKTLAELTAAKPSLMYVVGAGGLARTSRVIPNPVRCQLCKVRSYPMVPRRFTVKFDEWDGSDVFTLDNLGPVFCSERGKEKIESFGREWASFEKCGRFVK